MPDRLRRRDRRRCRVLETAQVWEGARVGVIGCGAVGLSVIQGARIAGAAEIHAIDLDERKLEQAMRFGATHTGAGRGSTSSSTSSAAPQTFEQALAMLGHGGTLVYIGLSPAGETARARRCRALRQAHAHPRLARRRPVPAEDFPRLAQWALDGRLDLAGMVTRTIGLDDVERRVRRDAARRRDPLGGRALGSRTWTSATRPTRPRSGRRCATSSREPPDGRR